jgi:hypothetical protein
MGRFISKSFALQLIFGWLDKPTVIRWQRLFKRFYKMFAPAILRHFEVNQFKRAFSLTSEQTGLKFLNGDLKWEFVEVKEAGTTRLKNIMYFKRRAHIEPEKS